MGHPLEMPFEALPSEIQIEIFSYLTRSHLKTVRRVCRAFRDNAEPTLFRSIIAAARYQALGAFQKISLFPVFQKHVREIIFDGSLYGKMLTSNERFYHTTAARIPELEQGFHWQKHNRYTVYIREVLHIADACLVGSDTRNSTRNKKR